MKKTLLSAVIFIAPLFASAQSSALIELLQPHDLNPLAQNNLASCKRELGNVFSKLSALQVQTTYALQQCSGAGQAVQEIYRLRSENARLTGAVVELRNENRSLRAEVRRLQNLLQPQQPVVSPAQLLDACNKVSPYNPAIKEKCFVAARNFQLTVSTISTCGEAFRHSDQEMVTCLEKAGQNRTTDEQIKTCSGATPYNNSKKLQCIELSGSKRIDLETIRACSRSNTHNDEGFINCLRLM